MCRFIGWFILATCTFGVGFLWLVPYVHISDAKFYDDILKSQNTTEKIEENKPDKLKKEKPQKKEKGKTVKKIPKSILAKVKSFTAKKVNK